MKPAWDISASREERIRRSTTVDVLVIGGGVNGLAVAWSAALSGLSVLVVDKGDWGSGTSSWSSRLIHGGLKYLEKLDIRLVRESLSDREWLLRAAPHLVKPMPFLLPYFSGGNFPKIILRLGMVLYDILSLDKSLPWHRNYSKKAVLQKWPGIIGDRLRGGSVYYDAQIENSERLCIELMLAAREAGAITMNHCEVVGLRIENGRVTGANLHDHVSETNFTVDSRLVINVAGAWIDDVLSGTPVGEKTWIGGTKGTHLAVAARENGPTTAVYFESDDARPMLIIPWKDMYLLGSTDKRISGGFDTLSADQEEIDYILYEVNKIYPDWNLTEQDIHYWYTGVRPLPFVSAARTADISRRHEIHGHRGELEGLLTITGGKLTTFRALSTHVMKKVGKVFNIKPVSISNSSFPGRPNHGSIQASVDSSARVERLDGLYGALADRIRDRAAKHGSLAEIIDPDTGITRAEIQYAVTEEEAVTVADIVARRVCVGLNSDLGESTLHAVARAYAELTGATEAEVAAQVQDYRNYTRRFRVKAEA